MNLIEQDQPHRSNASHAGRSVDVGDDHGRGRGQQASVPEPAGDAGAAFLGLRRRSRQDVPEQQTNAPEHPAALSASETRIPGATGSRAAPITEKSGDRETAAVPRKEHAGNDASGSNERTAKLAERIARLHLVDRPQRNDAVVSWSFIKKDREPSIVPSPSENPTPLQEQATQLEKSAQVPVQPDPHSAAQELHASLSRRYLIADDKYFFRDRQQILAFEASEKRIATVHDDPDVAHSMTDLAQAKGWSSIKLRGSEDFKRAVWLAASLRGMEVRGFRPKDNDKARLAELVAEIGTDKHNVIEKVESAARAPAVPADRHDGPQAPDAAHPDPAPPRLSKRHRAELQLLKTLLRDRGDSEQAVELTAALASEQLLAHRYYVGKLLDHGAAPYKHDPQENPSYFVLLDTPRGEKTVWGVDLARAVVDAQVERGTDLVLTHSGRKDVTVPKRVRMEDGRVSGPAQWEAATRNEWEITTIDSMRDLAAERVLAARWEHSPPQRPDSRGAATPGAVPHQEPPRSATLADREHDRSVR